MKKLIYSCLFSFFLLPFLYGQTCYEVIESNTGIDELYLEDLNEKACELKALVNTNGRNNSEFKVFGCDFYPVLHYIDPDNKSIYSGLFDKAIGLLERDHEGFIMITKEHYEDANIFYRLHIKFPEQAPFDILKPYEKDAITGLVLEAINNQAIQYHHSTSQSSEAEKVGLEKLSEIFTQLNNGTLILNNALEMAGFEAVPVVNEIFNRTGVKSNPSDNYCRVYDMAGLEVTNTNGETDLYRNSLCISLASEPSVMSYLDHAFILTDGENTTEEIKEAEVIFEESPEKIITWMHFYKEEPNGPITTVYIKYNDNLTEIEAENIVEYYFLETMRQWMPELFSERGYHGHGNDPNDPTSSLRGGGIARNNPCSYSFKFGKNCLLPKVGESFLLRSTTK